MFFASDNWAGVAPEISAALAKAGENFAAAYGTSDIDRLCEQRFFDIFERDVHVFFVATGTAANAMAISAISKPGGVVLCHEEAHINVDECGAIEYLTGGTRLKGLHGDLCKLNPSDIAAAIDGFDPEFVHGGRPVGVSITQATEAGAVYSVAEVEAIAATVHASGLPLHMDGARFANALVATNASAAEMSWKAGVDLLSFGATKNGCWCAEALVVFRDDLAEDIQWLRKRAGHLFSKTRFIAEQFNAYLEGDLWLKLATHANMMADKFADRLSASNQAHVPARPEGNELFVWLPREACDRLRNKGARFYDWPHNSSQSDLEMVAQGMKLVRLVTSFATEDQHIEEFMQNLAGA